MERPLVSNALEVVERFEAIVAAVLRLARRRAELADACGVLGFTARAGDRQRLAQQAVEHRGASRALSRRRDAVSFELASSGFADPVRGPRRREPALDTQAIEPLCPQRRLDIERDDA